MKTATKTEARRPATIGSRRIQLKRSAPPRTTAADIPDLYELAPGIGLARIPVLDRTDEQLSQLPLDQTTRRLLRLVDGSTSFAAILKVTDVPILDALPACRGLIKRGILEVRAAS